MNQPFYKASNPYICPLKQIHGITFTKREVDVIACLISGRSLKGISNFLGIHYKTLEVHMGNIRQKLGVFVRDYIVEALEKLPEYPSLKYRYQQLQQSRAFLEVLQKAQPSKSLRETGLTLFFHPETKAIAQTLQKQLKTLSCTIKVCLWNPQKNPVEPSLYIFPPKESLSLDIQKLSIVINPSEESSFYYGILKILKPHLASTNPFDSLLSLPLPSSSLKKDSSSFKKSVLKNGVVFILGIFLFYKPFPLPFSRFLDRPSLHETINKEFRNTGFSSTNPLIILVGPGGVGGTTMARTFLEHNSQAFCWEINGETKASLIHDYIALAKHLERIARARKITWRRS